jgi:L-asparaginase
LFWRQGTQPYRSGSSYSVLGIDKTVVITGSQKPVSFKKTDAKKNIKDALTFAANSDLSGVFVVFNEEVILGTRVIRMKTKSYDAFKSINFPYNLSHLKFSMCFCLYCKMQKIVPLIVVGAIF